MKIKITCRPRYNPWLKKYLNTKTFSKILALGILINSMPINSLAGILSEDGRYETFESSDITINNILEEDKVDVEIEGNTLVNYSHIKSFVANSVPSYNRNPLLEPGKTYTFSCNVSDIKNGPFTGTLLRIYFKNGSFITPLDITYEEGHYKQVFTIPSDKEIDYYYVGWIRNYTSGQSAQLDNIIILEGDWSNKEIPEYFEGMKSSFENNIKDDGSYGMTILSKNKNLFDIKKHSYLNIVDDYVEVTTTSNQYITYNLEKNTEYTLSFDKYDDNYASWIAVEVNGEYTNNSNMNFSKTYRTGDNGVLTISIRANTKNDIGHKICNIILEKGSKKSNFEYPEFNKADLYLNQPLRGLPNGVKDRIIKKNGQWFIERNCGEVTLNGGENWKVDIIHESTVSYILPVDNITDNEFSNKVLISDKFISRLGSNLWTVDIEGCGVGAPHAKGIKLNLNKEKLTSLDVNGLKKWLSNNPTTVTYQLETPVYEPLNIDSTVNTYLDTTHISTNSTIPANLKVTVDRTINRATEAIELAKTNPTIANLSRARYWTNLLKESNKKEELQVEINNNTDIVDLQLERKTASANLDVYIKCENMLVFTLDSNQITFDDFSGIEDIEKTNAVNISINSSLPYQLNAYLPNEIQNADRTKTMNKEILQLKESNETTYQAFTNTTDKVVLKDNCNSGNQLVHGIDIMLKGGVAHEKDVYKAVIKLEAEQK